MTTPTYVSNVDQLPCADCGKVRKTVAPMNIGSSDDPEVEVFCFFCLKKLEREGEATR
jgi:hypothetical protein